MRRSLEDLEKMSPAKSKVEIKAKRTKFKIGSIFMMTLTYLSINIAPIFAENIYPKFKENEIDLETNSKRHSTNS
jgi:hypothetical protein